MEKSKKIWKKAFDKVAWLQPGQNNPLSDEENIALVEAIRSEEKRNGPVRHAKRWREFNLYQEWLRKNKK